MYELDQRPAKGPQKKQSPIQPEVITLSYVGNTTQEFYFEYECDLLFEDSVNLDSYSVYINDQYYGDDVNRIQINNGDTLRIDVIKQDPSLDASVSYSQFLV
jgi:hypothetical protein